MSQHLPVPLMDLMAYAQAYKDGLRKWQTVQATDRIRELEERLHERDLAVAALSQQLDDCNRARGSDAERTPPPSPSEAGENTPVHTNIGGDEVQSVCDDSSAASDKDRPIITWNDSGDEHP